MKHVSLSKIIIGVLLMMSVSLSASAQGLRGDVNYDGNVNISDVTALIDYLLSDEWPDEEVQSETFTVNGVTFKMVAVQGGTFTMGATPEQGSDAESDETPTHQVRLSSFCIGETEVTQELWVAVMGYNPSNFPGDLTRPVEGLAWDYCQAFVTKLQELTGRMFRLPTEAEWEYAARGGALSQGYKYAGGNDVNEVAWHSLNASSSTQSVATKAPNELGLYDMSGNASEWCQDWYGDYSSDSQVNPIGPLTGTFRVVRGGSVSDAYWVGRVSCRSKSSASEHWFPIGMRLAL